MARFLPVRPLGTCGATFFIIAGFRRHMSTYMPANQTYAPKPSRPLGVAVIAILIGLFGFFLLFAGILVMVVGAILPAIIPSHFLGISSLSLVGIGAIILIIGLILMGVAIGLWHCSLWALVLCLLVLGLFIVSNVLSGDILTVSTVVCALLFIYLLAVHGHFR
jgi:hypothetical protein